MKRGFWEDERVLKLGRLKEFVKMKSIVPVLG
jgi:hypothetical protein